MSVVGNTGPPATAHAVIAPGAAGDELRARPAGFVSDVTAIAGRALRAVPRDMESVIPPIFISLFFFIVNIATLEKLTGQIPDPGFNFKAFMLPTAILLGVTGVSRAPAMVLDVQDGYLDRLLMTPISRFAILVGHMVADVAVAMALTVPILIVGFIIGVDFEHGIIGIPAFMVIAALWCLSFAGFGYAIALKTGNPAAVNSSFLLFFPFLFLTSSYVPRNQLSGWLDTVAGFNPVTYLLDGLRYLVLPGYEAGDVAKALIAIAVVASVSMTLCFAALRGRVSRG